LTVAIEDTEADLYAAIDRVAERIGRTLDRRLSRSRQFSALSSRKQPLIAEAE
jgi:putative sigma-54 modulation protein